jgi:hypothetical protein
MLPPFDDEGLLPPGEHEADWEEFSERFGWNERRRSLLLGLGQVIQILKEADCQRIWIDGSFVTTKEEPGDFDACHDRAKMSVLKAYDWYPFQPIVRREQKAKFGGEIFACDAIAHIDEEDPAKKLTYREFFQMRKDTNKSKGIVVLYLVREGNSGVREAK